MNSHSENRSEAIGVFSGPGCGDLSQRTRAGASTARDHAWHRGSPDRSRARLRAALIAGPISALIAGALLYAPTFAHAEPSAVSSPSAVPAPAPASAPLPESARRRLTFDVFLDERPIGFQHFDLVSERDGQSIETKARFTLDLLRIRALDYDHFNRERWRGGCLESIESRTKQNGKPYRVVGSARGGRFEVEGEEGRARLEGCVRTFAYWDRSALLSRSRLLNSQTGEYVAVETRALGAGRLRIGNRELAVERFAIRGEDLDIELAYASDSGEWLALDSPLFMGRMLRYRRSAAELPPAVQPGS